MTTPRLTMPLAARCRRWLACALLAVALPAASADPVVPTEPASPARAYLDLRAAVAKATNTDAVLPYLSATYRRVVTGLPAAERDGWLQRLKRVPPPGVKIQAQAVAGDRCALGAVARDTAHVKWSGRVELVREGGAWKLADETWRTEQR